MTCLSCGTKLDNNVNFCSHCGARVGIERDENESRQILKNCKSCSGELKQLIFGHYICEYCGREYFTNDKNEITDDRMTEKELLDILHKAAKYKRENKYWQELNCLLEAAEKAPNNTLLLVKLGRAYRRSGMYAKAVECYERALAIDPEDACAYVNLGAIYILINQLEKAEMHYKKGISLMEQNRIDCTNSDYAVAYANYAIAVGKQGRKREAKKLLKIAEENGYKNCDDARKMAGIKK